MSQQSISDKANVIRNETQPEANTRGRVADVLDDINETKANTVDVDQRFTAVANALGGHTESIQNIEAKNLQQDDAITNLQQKDNTHDSQISTINTTLATKLAKPLPPYNTSSYVVMGDGSTLPAGDLGRNIYNSDGTLTANRTINTSTFYLNFSGKVGINKPSPAEALDIIGRIKTDAIILNTNTESAIPNRIRTNGTFVFHTNSTSTEKRFMYWDYADYLALWNSFTEAQKTNIKTAANGGWTTATMSIFLINPIVVDNANNNKYVSLIGANLNLNPTSFSVTIVDINGNTVATVPNSQVNVSNTSGQNLIFYFNFSTIPAGTYKIKLWNGVATYTSGVTFRVATSVDLIDLSSITWNTLVYENLFNTDTIANNTLYAINAKTKDANGNVITYPGSGIFTTAGLSSALCTMNDNFVIEIGLFFNSDPALRDSLGGLAIDTVNSLANTLIAGARVQRGLFKTLGDVPVPGATLSNNQRIIFAKSENILTTVLYTSSGSISSITNVSVDNTPVKLKSIRGNYDAAPSTYNDALFNLQIITAYKF
ncbi:hypothetical protein CLU96_1230 [Chryseobacterium sp. 52]|uniref:hypothetical protein n=1 Tax=Chryseobacterium sp. 52 TaxID=2035213 RepID=UPI000C188568|nr:hypothetical protein [Chryseobacterium sp. 52]PIF44289.1 hypothetical protein CLU96_1230 [Chryseobacterium sp. 52]